MALWLDLRAGLSPDATVTQDDLAPGSAVPVEAAKDFFVDATRQMTSGVWRGSGHHTKLLPYPVNEFCCIIEGVVRIEGADGRVQTFRPGDAFVLAKGTVCAWHQDGEVLKTYVVFEPAEVAAVGEEPGHRPKAVSHL